MTYRFRAALCLFFTLLLPLTVSAADPPADGHRLSLREAVELALQNNLNLKLQKESTDIAAGSVEIAQSRFDRQLSAEIGADSQQYTPLYDGDASQIDTGSLSATFSKRFTTGTEMDLSWDNSRYDSDASGLTLNPSYGNSLTLSILQPLLRGWGREIQTGETQAARKILASATFQVSSQAADLAAQVKTGYWNLVFAWQDIGVKKLSLTLAKKLLAETREKIKAGALAEVDLYQPLSEVALREEDLIAGQRAIGAAEDELKLLINSNDWFSSFIPTDKPQPAPVTLDPQAILTKALANRPDLKSAELAIEAARIREKIARDNLRPRLDLVGRLGYGGTDSGYDTALDAAVDDPNTHWQVGVSLTVPLDNSAARGSLRQARANHNIATTSAQLLRLEIKKSVRTTVRDIRLAIKAMEATRRTTLATLKRLEAEQAKFKAGRSTTLDVLIAQQAYSQALSQENKTDIDYMQSLAELDRIQGLVQLPGEM